MWIEFDTENDEHLVPEIYKGIVVDLENTVIKKYPQACKMISYKYCNATTAFNEFTKRKIIFTMMYSITACDAIMMIVTIHPDTNAEEIWLYRDKMLKSINLIEYTPAIFDCIN